MIIEKKALSMSESIKYLDKENENAENMKAFIEGFVKLNAEKAKEVRNKLEAMEMVQLRDEHLAKIIDLLPDNREDLNKILNDVNLDEDEAKKILETLKEFQ